MKPAHATHVVRSEAWVDLGELGRGRLCFGERGILALDLLDLPDDGHVRPPRVTARHAMKALADRVQGIPLTPAGTDFQKRVWATLAEVPWGGRWTYAELAQAIGSPRAVRAVAGACAANPVALLIPCHRVLRTDGGLGGYRWGLARKAMILKAEALSAREAAGQ